MAATDAVERGHNRDVADALDSPEDPPATGEKRCGMEDLHSTFVAEKEIVKEHEQWRGPEIKAHWNFNGPSPADKVDAALSAWAADECSKALGQGHPGAEERLHGGLARVAKERELAAWKQSTF